ncbi:MAG: DUF6612 family protein [Acutalibacteraceae bacterium]
MKKKLLSVVLAALMVVVALSFAGCDMETAYSLITDAIAKTENLDSVEAKLTMNINMSMTGMTLEVPVTMNVKASGLQGDSPVALTDMTTSMLGQDITMEIYQEGEYFYITSDGETYKMKTDEETADMDALADMDSIMQGLSEDILKDVEIVKNENNTKTISVTLSDETFTEIYKDLIGAVNESVANGSEISNLNITNAKVEITVNADGYVAEYRIAFDMSMTVGIGEEAVDVTAKADTALEYNEPGKDVTVTAPEGYQSFEEFTNPLLNDEAGDLSDWNMEDLTEEELQELQNELYNLIG